MVNENLETGKQLGWEPHHEFLSLMFGKDEAMAEGLGAMESKLGVFEKALAQELSPNDTIEKAMEKLVKIALASEYGMEIIKSKTFDPMVTTIVSGIMTDHALRKQALVIIDRFTSPEEKIEKLRAKKVS